MTPAQSAALAGLERARAELDSVDLERARRELAAEHAERVEQLAGQHAAERSAAQVAAAEAAAARAAAALPGLVAARDGLVAATNRAADVLVALIEATDRYNDLVSSTRQDHALRSLRGAAVADQSFPSAPAGEVLNAACVAAAVRSRGPHSRLAAALRRAGVRA